jgi:hypothetical protein
MIGDLRDGVLLKGPELTRNAASIAVPV